MVGLDFLCNRAQGLVILTFGLQQVFSSVAFFSRPQDFVDQVSDFRTILVNKAT